MKNFLISACVFLGCFAVSAASLPAGSLQGSSASTKTVSSETTSAHKKHRRKHYSRRTRYHGPVKPTPERVSEIQSALAKNGYYHGDPNGKWDDNSVQAMRKFQEDHGLDGTGKIDALSLQKLGLGSEIAGVDAPRSPQHTAAPGQPTPAPASATPANPKTPKSPDSGSGNQ